MLPFLSLPPYVTRQAPATTVPCSNDSLASAWFWKSLVSTFCNPPFTGPRSGVTNDCGSVPPNPAIQDALRVVEARACEHVGIRRAYPDFKIIRRRRLLIQRKDSAVRTENALDCHRHPVDESEFRSRRNGNKGVAVRRDRRVQLRMAEDLHLAAGDQSPAGIAHDVDG